MSKGLSFIDVNWLQLNGGLTRKNVMDYFCMSPFYDINSNNELIKMQYSHNLEHLRSLTGLEFHIDNEHIDEPHLYVIRKVTRKSPNAYDLLESYYILDGSIYQSPDLLELIRCKTWKACSYLAESYHYVLDMIEYNSKEGTNIVTWEKKEDTSNNNDDSSSSTQNSNTIVQTPTYAQTHIRECPGFDLILQDIQHYN